jgi:hypothetical protein
MSDNLLRASLACPICGLDTPHSHFDGDAEIELFARPTFEFQLRHWLRMYQPKERTWRGIIMGVAGWTSSWRPQRSTSSPPDYTDPIVDMFWGFWLNAWLSKPSWCKANDDVAQQKQIERQTASPPPAPLERFEPPSKDGTTNGERE